ncbi:MAG: hypothetical protein LBP51_06260, partial [Deferribacteraceae bacterium]|nr:hypothetical protein [Deferribacteraceae bacterium]
SFAGTLDGGGKSILNLSFATNPSQANLGFFDELDGGVVKNLTIEVVNGNVNYTPPSADIYFGVFAGKLKNGASITNSTAAGKIAVTATSSTATEAKRRVYVGALAGSIETGSSINNSSSRVDVEAYNRTVSATLGDANPFAYTGGIVGILKNGTLTNVYTGGNITARSYVEGTGNLLANDDTETYAGGIAGYQSSGTIENSYAYGNIVSVATTPDGPTARAGGIVGAIESGVIKNSLGINIIISATTKHKDGRVKGVNSVGRVAGYLVGAASRTKDNIYGNANLNFGGDTATVWNGVDVDYYFRNLQWFWDASPNGLGFNYYDSTNPDANPWLEDNLYKYPCPLSICPIFYWEK